MMDLVFQGCVLGVNPSVDVLSLHVRQGCGDTVVGVGHHVIGAIESAVSGEFSEEGI
jgi:hypothetical protein